MYFYMVFLLDIWLPKVSHFRIFGSYRPPFIFRTFLKAFNFP